MGWIMEWIDTIHGFVWGIPALVLMLGIGVYITVRTGFVQFALFPEALKAFGKMLIGKGKKNAGVS